MATIIEDKYVFDFSVDDAVKNILSLEKAIENYESAVKRGEKVTDGLVKSDEELLRARKKKRRPSTRK